MAIPGWNERIQLSSTKQTEAFLRDNLESLIWDCVAIHQDLSTSFIDEFHNKLNFTILVVHNKISLFQIVEHWNLVNWKEVANSNLESFNSQRISSSFDHHLCMHADYNLYKSLMSLLPKAKAFEPGFVKSRML